MSNLRSKALNNFVTIHRSFSIPARLTSLEELLRPGERLYCPLTRACPSGQLGFGALRISARGYRRYPLERCLASLLSVSVNTALHLTFSNNQLFARRVLQQLVFAAVLINYSAPQLYAYSNKN